MNLLCKKNILVVLSVYLYYSVLSLSAQENEAVLVLDVKDLHVDSLRNSNYHHYKLKGILEQPTLNLFQQATGGKSNSFVYSIDLSETEIKDSISFSYIFSYYSALDTISLPKEGRAFITNMRRTFMGTRIKNLDLRGCFNIKDISDICRAAPKVQKIDLSDCAKIEDMTLSFLSASSLTDVIFPTSAPNLSKLIHAFYGTKIKKIVLPTTVSADCNMSHTFVACSRLESVTLPENLTNLYDGVFHSCPLLSEIIYEGKSFLQSDSHQFYSSASKEESSTKPKNMTLWVKADNLKYYITDPVWGQMKNILPLSSSRIDSSTSQQVFSISRNKYIVYIHSDVEAELQIYTLGGVLLKRKPIQPGDNFIEGLSEGIYLLAIQSADNQIRYRTKLTF